MGSPPNYVGEYRDGLYKKRVVVLSTGSTNIDLRHEDSGTIFRLAEITTAYLYLPRISSLALGTVFELVLLEQASSADVKIVSLDSSALIQSAFSSIVDNATTICPNSTFLTAGRFTAVSSVVWILEQMTGHSGHFGTTAADSNIGGWTTG